MGGVLAIGVKRSRTPDIEMLSTSGIRISAIVDAARTEDAVGLLHAAFELDRPVG